MRFEWDKPHDGWLTITPETDAEAESLAATFDQPGQPYVGFERNPLRAFVRTFRARPAGAATDVQETSRRKGGA